MYMTVSMRLTTLHTENTLKYVYRCKYVQYTSHIHTIYCIDTYIIRHTYIQHTSVDICMYMYVYTPMYSCCQHLKLLYSPKNDRHFRETQKVFLMSIYQLALANQEAKSWPMCLRRTGSCLLV